MKILIRSFLLAGLLGCLMALGTPSVSAAPIQKTVLVLFPFQPDLPVSQLALQTVQNELGNANDLALTVYYEFMDSNRYADDAYMLQLFDLYATKYRGKPIDLVMIETASTLRTWLTLRDKIAPNAPVVFFDTLSETFADWTLPSDVTGVGGVLDYTPSIEWIMRARPAVNEVILVHGVGALDLVPNNIRPVQALVQAMGQKVRFTDLSNLPLPEIKRRVAALSQNVVVVSHPTFEDAAGDKYDPADVLRQLTAVSPVPVIVGFDLSIGNGAIGGNMYSLEQQTRQAAQMGLRILRGEAVSSIPRLDDQSGPFVFDHLALQRYDIPLSALPADSIIKNRQYSFWELYQPQIIAVNVGVVILLLLIIFLLGVTRQLNHTRLALADLNSDLESQVQERTTTLNQTNTQLQGEITEHKQAEEALQESELKLKTLIELLPVGVSVLDADSHITYVNPALEKILDITRDGLVRGDYRQRSYLQSDGAIMPTDKFASARAAREKHAVHNVETGVVKEDGQVIWTNVSAVPVALADWRVVIVTTDITTRKQAEVAVRESEERFHSLADTAPVLVWMSGTDTLCNFFNQPWLDFTGRTMEQELGNGWAEGVHADDLQRCVDTYLQAFHARQPFTMEYRLRRADGEYRWLVDNGVPRFLPDGSFIGYIGSCLDISDRKRAEEALRETNAYLENLINYANAPIIVWDPQFRITRFNHAFEFLTGRSEADVLGKSLELLFPPELAASSMDLIRQTLTGERWETVEIKILHRDESVWTVLWNSATLFAPDGKTPIATIAQGQDITERKRAEEQLRDSERRTATILRLSPIVIGVSTVAEGRYTDVNDAFEHVLGFGRAETVDRTSRELNLWADDEMRSNILREIQAHGRVENLEIRLRRKSGEVFPALMFITPITLHNTSCLLTMMMDITERKRAEEALRETNAYLENLINYANAPIIVWDPQFRITRFNHAFESLTGRSEADVVGKSLDLLFPPELAASSMDLIRQTLTGERWETVEIKILHRDESVRTVLWNSATLFAPDGKTPVATIAQGQDITDRKRAEEQLRETRDALQTIIYSSPLAILTLDAEDRVTMWNPAAEEMFGWSDKQVLGQVNPTVPESKRKEYKALAQATFNGMAFSNIDTLRLKKDGEQFPVSISVAPLRGQQNQVVGRMHVITDITERKRLQEELRQQATTDVLTGISNRRHFLELAANELKRAVRLNHSLALALIDLDHFKQINDTYGHAAGDQVLKTFTQVCQRNIRDIDVFARFGGDEFIMLLPETTGEQAREAVERIRLALTAQPIDLDGKPVSLTLSSGVASFADGDTDASLDALLGRADHTLYRAKEAGRNRVETELTVAGLPTTPTKE